MKRMRRVRRAFKSSARRLLQLLAPGRTRHVRVLTYHSIDDSGSLISVTRDEFRHQLAVLRDLGVRGLTASQFVEHAMSENRHDQPSVLITFDDGYENFVDLALPLLKEYGFPATVFVVPQLMGQTPIWYQRDAIEISRLLTTVTHSADEMLIYLEQMQPLHSVRLMSWEQAKHIVADGIDVSSHSNEHCFLTMLTDEQIACDLAQSRDVIREKLKVPADLVCYPYGDCDARVSGIARQVGYRVGFCVEPSMETDPLQLGRWSIGPELRPRDLRYLFSRASDIEATFRERVRKPRGT